MENKNGSGIFLGVVSVATLVVAIVGATFAYFTSQMESAPEAVNVTAYEFATTVTVTKVAPADITAGLIPMNASDMDKALNNKCSALNNYVGCVIYKAELTNTSNNAATLSVALETTSNSKFTNLKFQEISSGDNGSTFTKTSKTSVALPTTAGNSIASGLDEITVPAKGNKTHYFVVYLNEAGAANETEMGGKYTGKLVYTSTTGAAGGLTAEFQA